MDDIFDSLIYIIIAIAVFAISALGKKKQARRASSTPDKQVEKNTSRNPFITNIEQLIREEIGIQDENIFEPEHKKDVVIETKSTEEPESEILDSVPPEMLDDIEDIPYSIEYDDTSEIFSKSIGHSDITKKKQEENPLVADFDLQKAIIYSEIINRKEF